MIELVECPRDAMQGMHTFIPTEKKVAYLNALLKVGFHTLDFGSFVSPKAIPQLKDTKAVLPQLELDGIETKLLAIVANERGANDAVAYDEIHYLGYPFSVSETFQQRNTNASIEDSLQRVENISNLCVQHNKTLVLYLSMGFGNPYGDPWSPDLVTSWSERLHKEFGVSVLALSDTIGVSTPEIITDLFTTIIPQLPNATIGAHLHSTPTTWREKVEAAYAAGCERYDGALKGYGGCPMAKDELVGNMDMLNLHAFFKEYKIDTQIDEEALNTSVDMVGSVFPLF